MPQRRIVKASDLSGLFIYQDPKRGTVYYDILSRKGFILTSSDVKTYTLYTAMLPLCMIAALLCTSFFHITYVSALLIFIALYLLAAIAFRIFFFYKLPEAENWKPRKRDNIIVSMATNFSKARLIILIFLLLALTVLMPAYAVIEKLDGFNLYASYILAFLTAIGSIIAFLALIRKVKDEKDH